MLGRSYSVPPRSPPLHSSSSGARNRWSDDEEILPEVISEKDFFSTRGRAPNESLNYRGQSWLAHVSDGVMYEMRAALGMSTLSNEDTWTHSVHRRWGRASELSSSVAEPLTYAAGASFLSAKGKEVEVEEGADQNESGRERRQGVSLRYRRWRRGHLAAARESLAEATDLRMRPSDALKRLSPDQAESLTSILWERLERADRIPPGSVQASIQRRLGIAHRGSTFARRMSLKMRDTIVAFVMVCNLVSTAVDACLGIGYLVAAVMPESIITHSGELSLVFIITGVVTALPAAGLLLLDGGYWMLFRDTAHDRTSITASSAAWDTRIAHIMCSVFAWIFLAFDLLGGRGFSHGLAYPLHSLSMMVCMFLFMLAAIIQVLAMPGSYFWNHRRASHLANVPQQLSILQKIEKQRASCNTDGPDWEKACMRSVSAAPYSKRPDSTAQYRTSTSVTAGGSLFVN